MCMHTGSWLLSLLFLCFIAWAPSASLEALLPYASSQTPSFQGPLREFSCLIGKAAWVLSFACAAEVCGCSPSVCLPLCESDL